MALAWSQSLQRGPDRHPIHARPAVLRASLQRHGAPARRAAVDRLPARFAYIGDGRRVYGSETTEPSTRGGEARVLGSSWTSVRNGHGSAQALASTSSASLTACE